MATDAVQVQPVPISALPKHDQLVEHNGSTYRTIREGAAHILVPSDTANETDRKDPNNAKSREPQSVFYNPIQQFNRDLSVLAIRAIGRDVVERRMTKINARSQKQRRKDNNKRRKANDGSVIAGEDDSAPVTTEQPDIDQPTATNGTETAHDNVSASVQSRPKPRIQFRILDALSATGLRALRYAHEIEVATHITANDLLETATDTIRMNVKHNKLEGKITANTGDARAYMYKAAFSHGSHDYGKYDVIDLDPYGTAAPFLDAAIEAVHDGGMLCVTCTDAGVFASVGYLEKSFALYGGLPIKGQHSHEGGLRLILSAIATTAARYGKSIEPLLSLSIDFYARVFVRIHKSQENTKLLAGKTALIQQCDSGCGAWTVQPIARTNVKTGKSGQDFFKFSSAQTAGSERCHHCGFKTHIAGPMYMGPLHNPFFITKLLSELDTLDRSIYGTVPRIEGMLTSALDELDVINELDHLTGPTSSDPSDPGQQSNLIPLLPAHILDPHPFHFNPSALSKVIHCIAPPEAAIRGALRAMGYVTTRSHTKPGTIKTQAPWTVIWHVMREWVRQRAPVKVENQKAGTAGWEILGLGREGKRDGPGCGSGSGSVSEPGVGSGDGANDTIDPVPSGGACIEKAENQGTSGTNGEGSKGAGKQADGLPEVVFDAALGMDSHSHGDSGSGGKKRKLVRYQTNPRANWGPMARATASK